MSVTHFIKLQLRLIERKENFGLKAFSKKMYNLLGRVVRRKVYLGAYFEPLHVGWNSGGGTHVLSKHVWKSCRSKAGVPDGKFEPLL